MLKIARFELKKSRRRYGRGSLALILLAVVFSGLMGYLSVISGIDSDSGIYTTNIEVGLDSFSTAKNPDVFVNGESLFVQPSDRSLAAADELINYLKEKHTEEIEKEYGEMAHPLKVNVVYVNPSTVKVEEGGAERNETQARTGTGEGPEATAETPNTTSYIPPEEIKTPGLVERMVMAFLFIIPSYFVVQVFSSSLLEDKLLRRLEVLLSAVSRRDLLFGKILPYFILALLSAMAVSFYLKTYVAFVFVLPVVLLLFSAQSFVVMISRTYREATFLLLVVSLLVTIYAFIPAVFSSAIPLSKISPITLLLSYINGDSIALTDALISFTHYTIMATMLFYFSMKALNPDIAHGKEIFQKLVEISRLSVGGDAAAFVMAFLSISFAFMAELFAILTVFALPPQMMIPALLISVAVVEEFIKGLIIFSGPTYRRAIFTALGFFAGEKVLIILNILQNYSIAFLGKFLVLPLFFHIATAVIIVLFMNRGYGKALLSAIALHAAYDYLVVMLLA